MSYSQVVNSNEIIKEVQKELLGYNSGKAIKLIDSELLANDFSQDTLAILKGLKVAGLVQVEMYEDALYLANKVLQENSLRHPYVTKVLLQRALIYEILGERAKSTVALNRIEKYYNTHKKDRYYGEYLYRKASLLRVSGEEAAALEIATLAVDYCKSNKYHVEGAVAQMVLGLLTAPLSSVEARGHYNGALKEFSSYNDLNGMAGMYNALAKSYIKENEYAVAEKYLDSSMQTSKTRNDPVMLSYAMLYRSNFYERIDKADSALFYYKHYFKYNDSANFDKQALAVSQLDYNFELQKQQLAKEEISENLQDSEKYNKLFTVLLISLGLLLLVVVGFLFDFFRKNKKIELQNKDIDKSNTALTKSVSEKEFLLKELNHRVKNNLSLIIGLVKFHSNEIEDEFFKEKFNILEKRILAISLAHEQFVYSDDALEPSDCNMAEYINKIAESLIPFSGSEIVYHQSIENVTLSIETALPIGIIINELISNSLKHAKTDGGSLKINVSIQKKGSDIIIRYKDSGILFTETASPNSLGMYILDGMISQLDGAYSRTGTAYLITVKNQEVSQYY